MCKCVSFYNNRYTLYKYSKDFLLLFFKKEEKKEKDKNAVKLCEKNLFSAFLFIKYSVRFFRSNQFFLHLVSNRQIYYRHFHYSIQLFHGKEFAAHTFRFPFYFFYFFLHWDRIRDIDSTLFILVSVEFSLVFSSLHIQLGYCQLNSNTYFYAYL